MKNSTKYLLISFFTFVTGYLFLRSAYFKTEDIPFAQEIVLIVLGTIATIAITAALLSKQSEVEIDKEQRVKIFELKSNLYFELIDFLEKIILKSTINEKDLVKLEFLTHKISIIASSEVLSEYSNLLKAIKTSAMDNKINSYESDIWSQKLSVLCAEIRCDLVPENEASITKDSLTIKNNTDVFMNRNKKR
ncbi:MAG TPA: hypothetical protein ENJ95_22145 [Bacteroidetes bacterium]|nr:hypothetical protein [Bacteroidota bacterium]